jgi:hypothetical protein
MQSPSRRGFLRNSLSTAVAAPLASHAATPSAAPTRLSNAAWIPKTLDQWRARWIWEDYNRETTNIYVCLRKVINLEAAPRAAGVFVTASSVYKLWINGVEAGRGPEPNEAPFKFYDYYELAKLFHPGENIIAALAYNFGIGTHFYGAGPGGFLLEAHLTDSVGRETAILTDNTWRVALPRWYSRYAPQTIWANGFQENCDLRKEVLDWKTNPHEPSRTDPNPPMRWRWASEFGAPPAPPFTVLLPREIPPERRRVMAPQRVIHAKLGRLPEDWMVQQAESMPNPNPNVATRIALEVESAAPAGLVTDAANLVRDDATVTTIAPPPPGASARVLIEFPEEVVGYPFIEIESMDGGLLDVGYSEFLKPGEHIDMLRAALQADRIILGRGARRWQSYDRRAFRYLLLDAQGLRAPLKIRHVGITRIAYPVEYSGRFECSDPLLNKIWQVARLSCELNMHDHYEDGPVRERGQYAGDIRTTALWNYHFFGDHLLIAKGLRHFARLQDASGWFKTLSPSGTRHNIVEMLMHWAMAVWEYYWYTGDRKLALELAPHAWRALRWFESFLSEDGLIGKADRRDWWIFIDWGRFDFRDEIAGLNLWYIQGLDAATRLARLAGNAAEAGHFAAQAKRVRESCQRRFWNAREQAYVDCWTPEGPSKLITRQANYLAILSQAAPRETWSAILDRVEKPGIDRIETPYFKYFELCSWLAAGRPLTAVLNEIRAWWGEQVRRGASTFWEVFDDRSAPGTGPDGTCCHSWVGGGAMLLTQEVLGVKPAAPGFEKVTIQPQWADLEFARGAVPTPRGLIEVSWERNKRLEISIPDLEANVLLMVDSGARQVTIDARQTTITGGRIEARFTGRGRHIIEIR